MPHRARRVTERSRAGTPELASVNSGGSTGWAAGGSTIRHRCRRCLHVVQSPGSGGLAPASQLLRHRGSTCAPPFHPCFRSVVGGARSRLEASSKRHATGREPRGVSSGGGAPPVASGEVLGLSLATCGARSSSAWGFLGSGDSCRAVDCVAPHIRWVKLPESVLLFSVPSRYVSATNGLPVGGRVHPRVPQHRMPTLRGRFSHPSSESGCGSSDTGGVGSPADCQVRRRLCGGAEE